MAGALGDYATQNTMAGKRKVSNKVKNLVPDEFVAKAQRTILNASGSENDRVVLANAADQAHGSKFLFIFAKAKRARRGNLGAIGAVGEIDFNPRSSDWTRKIDVVADAIAAIWIDSDELVILTHFYWLQDAEIFATSALRSHANFTECLDIGQRATVQNRKFEIIHFHNHVVDSHANKRGKEVLCSGNQNTFAHKAGGIADFRDVAPDGFNFKIIEVRSTEYDTRTGGGRQKSHVYGCSAVKTDSGELCGGGEGMFQVRGVAQTNILALTMGVPS